MPSFSRSYAFPHLQSSPLVVALSPTLQGLALFLHYRRIVTSRSWFETSYGNVDIDSLFNPILTSLQVTVFPIQMLLHWCICLCFSLLRYLLNVSPFTLMKGTRVPENYVFYLVLIKVDYKDITLSQHCYYIYIYIAQSS